MAEPPYAKPYTRLTEVMQRFFRYDAERKEMRFVGDRLEVRVPKRFEVYGLLNIADTVEAVGVMDLIIDDRFQCSLHMLAKFETEPREIGQLMLAGAPYMVLRYEHGDRFIAHSQVVKEKNIVYALYVEFVTRGYLPYWFDYARLATLFDQAAAMCDAPLGVDHVVFELIYAHLARDPQHRFTQYRHTAMAAGFKWIALRDVGHAPDSTTARTLGSYFSEAVNSSLVHTSETRAPLEDLLRGLPVEELPLQ